MSDIQAGPNGHRVHGNGRYAGMPRVYYSALNRQMRGILNAAKRREEKAKRVVHPPVRKPRLNHSLFDW